MVNLIDILSWSSIFLGALGIIVTVIIYRRNKQTRKITCLFYPPLSLIHIKKEVKDKIKIFYNNKEAADISMMQISIINNGSLPIKKENIVKPIEFIFNETINIIENNILYTDPEDLSVECKKISNNHITCSFDLFNPKEEISLQFITFDHNFKQPDIKARIEGIKKINIKSMSSVGIKSMSSVGFIIDDIEIERPHYYFTIPGIAFLIIGLTMGLSFLRDFYLGESLRYDHALFMIILTFVGIFMAFTGILLHSISRHKK